MGPPLRRHPSDALPLRASHIKPWGLARDAERLDVYNGLLLAAHLDAAFDSGLISFAQTGQILIADTFGPLDRASVGIHTGLKLRHLSPAHIPYLAWHREHLFGGPVC